MKRVLLFLGILFCFLSITSCGKEKEVAEEWNYERLEEELGNIIELDLESLVDILEMFQSHETTICGYVGKDLTVSDELEDRNDKNTIVLMLGGYNVKSGNFVYLKGIPCSYLGDYYMLQPLSNNQPLDEPGEDAMSVNQYVSLMDKYYEDTYFKTEGLLLQKGTWFDGTPRYVLYSSEEAYNESQYNYVTLNDFIVDPASMIGKYVVVMGKPDMFIRNGLTGCNIIEEK